MSKTHQPMAADRSAEGDSRREEQAEDPEIQEPGTADGDERYQEAEFHKRKGVHQRLEGDDQAHVKSSSGQSLIILDTLT